MSSPILLICCLYCVSLSDRGGFQTNFNYKKVFNIMKTILISVDYFLCIGSSGGFYLALVIIITLRHRSMNE